MAQTFTSEIFSSTYRDDYKDSDNYHRVLFNSGRALQARELTQMQTIIQAEMGRLGKHMFKEGAAVNPGGVTVNTEYEFVKLDTGVNQLPDAIADLVGVEFTSAGSISFRVLEVVPATGSDPATLYITYTNTSSGVAGLTPVRVAPGEELTSSSFTLTTQSTNTISNPAIGQGCKASIHGGDFFAQQHFVFAKEQSKIISKYSNTPTTNLGFKVVQDIVTSSDDQALFDNQGATPNLASPGADRYRIALQIATQEDINSDENFIEIAKVVNGLITSQVTAIDSYNEIDNVLARRTQEESGDYIVKQFELLFETNDSDATKIDYILSPGVAYVGGFRAATTGETIITVPKPRTTSSENNQVVAANYGSYVIVEGKGGSKGAPNTNIFQEMNLRSAVTHGGSTVGTARVRHVEEDGANYRLYLFEISMNAGKNFTTDVKSIGDSNTDFWNLVLENGAGQIRDAANSALLFDLPKTRPQSISDISLTVQRRFSTQTNSTGAATISLTATGETFTDTNLWTLAAADSDVDTNAAISGAGSQSAAITGGAASQNPYEVLAYVNKSQGVVRTKTLTDRTQTITPDGSGNCALDKADIYSFDVIKVVNTNGDDISSIYETDDGQRDELYDLGKLNLIAGNTAPSSVYVEYKYFEHGAGGDFFAVNSYTGQVAYEAIPNFTKADGQVINLRNVLDFRPVVNSSGDFGSGSKINELPRPTTLITFDTNYYQGQSTKVVIDVNGQVKVVQGAPATDPKLPKSPENAMDLFNVTMNPYVIDNNDVQSEMLTYKRFTMADIGRLEQRLASLEETTALSLLELETSQFDVFDSAGLSRNKSGFFVDNFIDQRRSFVNSPDYKAAIDPSRKQMRPTFTNRNVSLFYDSDNSGNTNVVIRGDNIYLNYDEVDYLKNEFMTGTENVNPFAVVQKRGFMELSPASDEWFETEFVEPIVVDGGFEQGRVQGAIWDDWSFNWSGAENIATGDQLGDTLTGGAQQNNAGATRQGNTTTTPRFRVDQSVQVQGIRTSTTFIDEEGVEVNRTFIPFMRTRKVFFRAQGLKPNTRHFPFFGNKSVNDWVKQETFKRFSTQDSDFSAGFNKITQHPNTPTTTLLTDANGKLEGSFFLPNTNTIRFASGDKTFTLIDISKNDEKNCTSLAAARYYAQGVTVHRQQTVLSTRLVDLVVTQNTVGLNPSVVTVRPRRRANPAGGGGGKDPLAQSFMIQETTGVFITSIHVRFKSKPAEGGTPVVAQLRPMVNGVPSAQAIVPGSTVFKPPSAITTSANGTSVTTFTFEEPVYLSADTEYSIVLLSDSNDYNVYVAEAGAFLLGSTEKKLTKQATLGSLFKSQNGRTWEPDQTKDLTFKLSRANFSAAGSAIVENSAPSVVNLTSAIRTQTSDPDKVTIACRDHGFIVGDDVRITGSSAVGGIAANNINGVREVTSVDADNFTFNAGGNATSATTGGGEFRIERQNMFETMMLKVENILPPQTSISVAGKLTSGKSLAGTEAPYQKDTSFVSYPINRNITFPIPKLLASKRNANASIGAGTRSSTFKINMTSVSSFVSPVVDMQRTSVSTIHNRVDQNNALNPVAETNARGGSTLAKHLTRPVTLAEKARGLKIMLAANKPSACSFDVYYRTNSAGRLLDQEYVLIAPEVDMPSDDNPNMYRDYRYLPGGTGGSLDDFDQFQVKIVMKSVNSAKVPRFGDMRVIALTV